MNRGVWIAGLIALGAVVFFVARGTNHHSEKPSPAPPVPSLQPQKPKFTVVNIRCPACQGYGYIMTPGRTGMRKQVCELCGGKGGKVLRIPRGYVICPDCHGFGRVASAGRYVVCRRCDGRGYVRAPFQPDQ